MAFTDPDQLALLIVQQFLSERGYQDALAALEKQCALNYDEDKLDKASMLMEMVWARLEEQAASAEEDDTLAAKRAEEEALMRSEAGEYPQVVNSSIDSAHPANVLCVRLMPGAQEVVTGAGDGVVRRMDLAGQVSWSCPVGSGSGAVLSLELQPGSGSSTAAGVAGVEAGDAASATAPAAAAPLLAAGSMDGTLSIIDVSSGRLLASSNAHRKYLVRVAWAGDGVHLVTASHDQSVCVHRVEVAEGGGGGEVSITTIKTFPYTASVQDVAFLADGRTVVVAVRDSNYLRLLDVTDLEAPERLVNMNVAGDDHVSFFARHLATSPCGRYLLVTTDKPRLLVMRTSDWSQLGSLYGLDMESFHQPTAAWVRGSTVVLAGATGGRVFAFHVGTGRVLAKLPVHKVNVRDMHYDPTHNVLATCSFDKTVKMLVPPASS